MSKIKTKILHITEWIFTILGLIMALAMLTYSAESIKCGIALLVSALVISPFFEKILFFQKNLKKKALIQFIGAFVLFCVAVYFAPATKTSENKVSNSVVSSTTLPAITTTSAITTNDVITTSTVETSKLTTTSSLTTKKITSTTRQTTTTTTTTNTSTITTTPKTVSTTISEITTTTISENFIRNEELKGRGMADVGRNEPNYINTIGYVVISSDKQYELSNTDKFTDTSLWTAPALELDEQLSRTAVTLPHKTEVVVLEQNLEHSRYGSYSGYLLVQKLDDNKKYYIDVSNYITKPYWTYTDKLREAALTGMFIAEYHQVSDYYPITDGGNIVSLEDGTIVLVTKPAGLSRYVNPEQTEITADVWKNWSLGYGDVSVNFNSKDLTIIY